MLLRFSLELIEEEKGTWSDGKTSKLTTKISPLWADTFELVDGDFLQQLSVFASTLKSNGNIYGEIVARADFTLPEN